MADIKLYQHGGYILHCAPTRTDDGGFVPYVVLLRSSDGELIANRYFPASARCRLQMEAVAHARNWAMQWIDASQKSGTHGVQR